MALDFGEAGNAALASGTVRTAILFRINSNPVVRAWASVGDFPAVADLIETSEGAIYKGIGQILALPELTQLINGKADRIDFTISGAGVDAALADQAMAEAGLLRFARFNIGLQVLGTDWQPISRVVWLWEGECGPVSGNRVGGRESNPTRTISLSVGSAFAARRRPRALNFSNAHHQRLHPGDRFCERFGLYSAGTTRQWP